MKKADRIILVYNAENGLFNALNDWAHKIFSPETYDCRLCRFTYGLIGMRKPWKKFIHSLSCPATFLHRPDFQKAYPKFETDFPAIIAEREGRLHHLVSADEIAELENLSELIEFTGNRIFGDNYQAPFQPTERATVGQADVLIDSLTDPRE